MVLYQNRYRIESSRSQNFNYASNGAYFITICTKDRKRFLGKIIKLKNCLVPQIQLSKIGSIVRKCWLAIPDYFPFVILDEFIIMPNHIHGIIIINHGDDCLNIVETGFKPVSTEFCVSTIMKKINNQNKFGPQSKNLPSIIRGFKIGVTKYCRRNTNIWNIWQSRFYDRIIRNEQELNRIRKYIVENPQCWKRDRNNI